MKVACQLSKGYLVSPGSKKQLYFVEGGGSLVTIDQTERFTMQNGVPILLPSGSDYGAYVASSQKMIEEYTLAALQQQQSIKNKARKFLIRDYPSRASRGAYSATFGKMTEGNLCLSIGGGPSRISNLLTNLNVAAFPGVDVVGDGHCLPYRDECVDAIYCDAVLEHLRDPYLAVSEMARVLRKGAKAFVITPFMQQYHGYPGHYQNYTLTGHQELFRTHGFHIDAAGVSVGPTWVLINVVSVFINTYFPPRTKKIAQAAWLVATMGLRPLDLRLANHKNAHVLASTTFVLARKE